MTEALKENKILRNYGIFRFIDLNSSVDGGFYKDSKLGVSFSRRGITLNFKI